MNTLYFFAGIVAFATSAVAYILINRHVSRRNAPKDPYSGAKFPTLDQVRDLIDKKTSNCMQVGGKSHKDILHDLKRAERGFVAYIHTSGYIDGPMTGTLFQNGQYFAQFTGGEVSGSQLRGFTLVDTDDQAHKALVDAKYTSACSGPGWATHEAEVSAYSVQKAIDEADLGNIKWEIVSVGGNSQPLKGSEPSMIDSAYLPPVILARILLGQTK